MRTSAYAILSLLFVISATAFSAPPTKTSNTQTNSPSQPTVTGSKAGPVDYTCDHNSWLGQGKQLAQSGDCKKAMGALSHAIVCNVKDVWAWYYRALVRQGLGETALSKRDFDKANQIGAKLADFQNRKKPANGAPETFQWFFNGVQCQK